MPLDADALRVEKYNLRIALDSRDISRQAKGILMHMHKIPRASPSRFA